MWQRMKHIHHVDSLQLTGGQQRKQEAWPPSSGILASRGDTAPHPSVSMIPAGGNPVSRTQPPIGSQRRALPVPEEAGGHQQIFKSFVIVIVVFAPQILIHRMQIMLPKQTRPVPLIPVSVEQKIWGRRGELLLLGRRIIPS